MIDEFTFYRIQWEEYENGQIVHKENVYTEINDFLDEINRLKGKNIHLTNNRDEDTIST